MERTQFTFYVSWLNGISFIKNKAARCDAYEAIIRYALDGELPQMDKLPEAAAMAFTMAKPNIDVSRRNALNGAKPKRTRNETGAKPERNTSDSGAKPERNRNKGETGAKPKQEQEQVKEQVQEQVKEQSVISAREVAASDGIAGLCRQAGIRARDDEIETDVERFGEKAVLEAVRKARENQARTWKYVQMILGTQAKKPVNNSQVLQHGELSPMMAAAARNLMEQEDELMAESEERT